MTGIASTMVEVFIFARVDGVPHYLMLRRAANAYMPGVWQDVTGRLEEGENAEDAALREIREETGIVPTELWRVNHVSVFYAPRTHRIQCVPTFAVPSASAVEPKLSAEHDAWEWVDYAEALRRLLWSTSRRALEICQQEIAGVAEPNPWLRLIPPPILDMPPHEGPI
jgi:dATP pyrophosphohydrolase